MARRKRDTGKVEVGGNRKEDLNRIRGTQRIIDPERGESGKGTHLPGLSKEK